MHAQTPILHHYTLSPYSEKVRKVFGYKRMAWASVQAPPVLPKPDQIALTGGYRKAPILQLGRDVYCDTKLICKVLDRLQPQPPLVPDRHALTMQIVERWVDQACFWHAVALFFQPQGLAALEATTPGLLDPLIKDRTAMFAQGGSQPMPSLDTARAELPGVLAALETQLASQPYLFGDAPTQADFSLLCPIGFIRGNTGVRAELDAYPRLVAWLERMAELGEGQRSEVEGAAAVELCRTTHREQPLLPGAPLQLPGTRIGDRVTIGATDYAPDRVAGTLLAANAQELVLRREDARAGVVIVHFPPEGFSVIKV